LATLRGLTFLLLWLFLSMTLTSAMLYVFASGEEPSQLSLPEPPSNFNVWNPLDWAEMANFALQVFSLLFLGFPTTGIPSPLNWILSTIFWLMTFAVILVWARRG